MSPILNKLVVPVIDDNNNHIASLVALIQGLWLSDQIHDIVVGKSGYCYILELNGTVIAHKRKPLVTARANAQEKAKTDKSRVSLAAFEKMAVEIDEPSIGFCEYDGVSNIASYATMKTTDWAIIIKAPADEFMGTVSALRTSMSGNDEITDMAEYFNETIQKIGASIRQVGVNSNTKEVLTAIRSINTVTIEVQAGSEEMLKGGEGVAEEMQKLDNLTRIITESMNEMASGAVQISNAVQEVSEITQKNKRSIEALAEEVSKFKV